MELRFVENNKDNVVCPYCKHEHDNWQDFTDFEYLEQDFELDCENCRKWFRVYANFTPKFSTRILDKDIDPEY